MRLASRADSEEQHPAQRREFPARPPRAYVLGIHRPKCFADCVHASADFEALQKHSHRGSQHEGPLKEVRVDAGDDSTSHRIEGQHAQADHHRRDQVDAEDSRENRADREDLRAKVSQHAQRDGPAHG